jgi:hypothetical protein
MKSNQIDQLVATVPATINAAQRDRLHAYIETATRCEARIQRLRAELPSAFEVPEAVRTRSSASGSLDIDVATELTTALAVACELDTLERVQPRVDAWLKQYVAKLVSTPSLDVYGDG